MANHTDDDDDDDDDDYDDDVVRKKASPSAPPPKPKPTAKTAKWPISRVKPGRKLPLDDDSLFHHDLPELDATVQSMSRSATTHAVAFNTKPPPKGRKRKYATAKVKLAARKPQLEKMLMNTFGDRLPGIRLSYKNANDEQKDGLIEFILNEGPDLNRNHIRALFGAGTGRTGRVLAHRPKWFAQRNGLTYER